MQKQPTNKQQKNNNREEFQLLSLINLTNCRCTDVLRYTAQSKIKVPSLHSENDIDYLLAFVLKKERNLLWLLPVRGGELVLKVLKFSLLSMMGEAKMVCVLLKEPSGSVSWSI